MFKFEFELRFLFGDFTVENKKENLKGGGAKTFRLGGKFWGYSSLILMKTTYQILTPCEA